LISEEVTGLLQEEGIIPHGGGTSILKGGMKRVKGLIDFRCLDLSYFRTVKGMIEIGAACTYSEVVDRMHEIDPCHILVKALSQSASTPLRNRISIGGSVALFPIWSDLMGPLLALEAEVSLIGKNRGRYPIGEYINKRELRKDMLITAVLFKQNAWNACYYRETRTRVDYPCFSITILVREKNNSGNNVIEEIKIVIIGSAKRFSRLTGLEETLKGQAINSIKIEGIGSALDVEFVGRKALSAEYIKANAGIQLERGLKEVLKIK